MARIKQVLNERRLAYDDAVEMFKEGATPEPEPEPEPTPAEPKASLFEADSTPSLEAKPSS
jgi:hypothetical protein